MYDSNQKNWLAVFTGVISYDSLKNPIVYDDTAVYRFCMQTGSLGRNRGFYDLAYMSVDASTLANITPGTQAIIEWTMQLLEEQ